MLPFDHSLQSSVEKSLDQDFVWPEQTRMNAGWEISNLCSECFSNSSCVRWGETGNIDIGLSSPH